MFAARSAVYANILDGMHPRLMHVPPKDPASIRAILPFAYPSGIAAFPDPAPITASPNAALSDSRAPVSCRSQPLSLAEIQLSFCHLTGTDWVELATSFACSHHHIDGFGEDALPTTGSTLSVCCQRAPQDPEHDKSSDPHEVPGKPDNPEHDHQGHKGNWTCTF